MERYYNYFHYPNDPLKLLEIPSELSVNLPALSAFTAEVTAQLDRLSLNDVINMWDNHLLEGVNLTVSQIQLPQYTNFQSISEIEAIVAPLQQLVNIYHNNQKMFTDLKSYLKLNNFDFNAPIESVFTRLDLNTTKDTLHYLKLVGLYHLNKQTMFSYLNDHPLENDQRVYNFSTQSFNDDLKSPKYQVWYNDDKGKAKALHSHEALTRFIIQHQLHFKIDEQ